MEFMCIINRMPVIPVPHFIVVVVVFFFLTIQQTFNEWLLFSRYPGIWGHHKKPHPNGDPSLVSYHTANTMPLGKSLHLGRLALLSVTQQSDVNSESGALRWQQLEEGW